jgi:hypothetical protein
VAVPVTQPLIGCFKAAFSLNALLDIASARLAGFDPVYAIQIASPFRQPPSYFNGLIICRCGEYLWRNFPPPFQAWNPWTSRFLFKMTTAPSHI